MTDTSKNRNAPFWLILKNAARRLQANDPLHLAGATAFFATFALAPIFVVIVQLLGALIGKGEVKEKLIEKFAQTAPRQTVHQLRQIMDGLQTMSGAWYVDVLLILFLLFSASTLFKVIRRSVYRLWRIKDVPGKSTNATGLKHRLLSLALVISAGVLLVAGLVGERMQFYLGDAVAELSPSAAWYLQSAYRHVISLAMSWAWFSIVFRYLTDVRPQWKTAMAGALFTACLFAVGKLLLQFLLSGRNISTVFGASASLVVLQLFVFYSSLLIYYGACFTMEWSRRRGQPMQFPGHISYYAIEEKNSKDDIEHNQ